jgi:ABC-type branched-subunit amino acid transport system ATPase component
MMGGYARADRHRLGPDIARIYEMFPRVGATEPKCRVDVRWRTTDASHRRALLSRPRCLLLDELTLGLAPIIVDECGWTISGLPGGLQIVGRPFDEDTLLCFAYTLQENLGFAHSWPSLS